MAVGSWIGVDVGGSKLLAVKLGPDGAVEATATAVMPGRTAPGAELEDAVVRVASVVADGGAVAGLGVAVAGLVDAAAERFLFGAHLPWRDEPIRERLARRTGWTVAMDNDANCAARAEVARGAARGAGSALVITLGTGIGGAVVIDGRVIRGAHGLAGEFGHQQVVPDGLACECGLRGCWEQYSSGRALERVTRVALGRHLDGPEVTRLAREGDVVAQQAFATIGTWLGVGVAGLVSSFDPEIVVVGGGVSAVGDLLFAPARAALAASLQGTAYRPVPPLLAAELGPEAGAIGAALLVSQGSV
ncbi:ROK family protein [Nocardioides caeni]|uniref:ROK family protein n=1 Tax=Nocardioides caeni TaxID=574700 RepID=A0A4S8NPR3_9ACTN|nr:ROK family protein [Nocardioides caeni]THV18515.1 ROK family protein [Nocardioides caeni]